MQGVRIKESPPGTAETSSTVSFELLVLLSISNLCSDNPQTAQPRLPSTSLKMVSFGISFQKSSIDISSRTTATTKKTIRWRCTRTCCDEAVGRPNASMSTTAATQPSCCQAQSEKISTTAERSSCHRRLWRSLQDCTSPTPCCSSSSTVKQTRPLTAESWNLLQKKEKSICHTGYASSLGRK